MVKFAALLSALGLSSALSSPRGGAGAGVDVDALLSTLTLEEKVGQMVQIDIDKFMLYEGGKKTSEVNFTMVGEWIRDYRIGSILNTPFSFSSIGDLSAWSARKWRDNLIEIQNLASTLGSKIPIIYGIDSIHGASYVGNATLFPQQIGLAATFNTQHAYVTGQITSKDTRVAGIPWVFSPVLGVAVQPLWSRFYETFGEDTYLISQMGAEIIRGYQWDPEDGGFPERVAACMKHFIAYSDPENGHDRSPVQLPHRMLKQLYSQQFQAAVDAGVLTAMESYQEVGGVPMVSSRDYLKKLLRVEMNFTGFMVTDYREIENLHDWHHVAATEEDAVRITLQDTSVDQSMVPLDESFYKLTLDLVKSGKIPESRIDESARRILQVKNSLGLLTTPVPPVDHPLLDTVGQKEDWDAALDACRESLTLLKNENGVLPLKEADAPKLFVTGPTCDSLPRQTGGWSVHWQGASSDSDFNYGKTVLDGLKDVFSEITYLAGPDVKAESLDGVDLAAARDAASAADAVVVCVGEETYTEKPGDIDKLDLPAGQSEYVSYLRNSTSKPIVLVIISGRPRLLNGCVENSDAVVEAYLPGPMGGQAVAEVLSGRVVPSGRIPFSYPKHHGAIPYPYHRKTSDMCTDPNNGFNYIPCEVEWPFGAGLSYTTFEYSELSISSPTVTETGQVTVSVRVTNTGSVAASHVVMLFLFDIYRRVTPEYKLLRRFERVSLTPASSQVVSFTLSSEDFEYYGVDGGKLMESGEFRVAIGHETDCRTHPGQCVSFELQTSSAYAPVCDYGCHLWESGILCGQTQTQQSCQETCREQQWSWDYIGCLEEYATGDCTKEISAECFDAFAETQTGTSDTCSGYTKDSEVRLYLALGIVFGVLGGAALMAVAAYFYIVSSGAAGPVYDKLINSDNSFA